MQRTATVVCLVALLLAAQANPQATQPAAQPQTVYAAIALHPGLPDFGPLKSMLPGVTYSARIPYDREGYTVYFTWGRDGDNDRFCLYLTYPDGSMTVKSFSLVPGANGIMEGVVEFNAETSTEDLIPLAFRLLPDHLTLLFHWVGSPSSASGGTPTVKNEPLKLGTPIPDMVFVTLEGDTLSTSQFRETITVLNWWATTCVPCIAEMPDLNELVDRYGASGKVRFVAVALDNAEKVDRLLQRHAFRYQQTLGTKEHAVLFGESFPRHVVIGQDGVVAFDRRGAGPKTPSDIATTIESLTAQQE